MLKFCNLKLRLQNFMLRFCKSDDKLAWSLYVKVSLSNWRVECESFFDWWVQDDSKFCAGRNSLSYVMPRNTNPKDLFVLLHHCPIRSLYYSSSEAPPCDLIIIHRQHFVKSRYPNSAILSPLGIVLHISVYGYKFMLCNTLGTLISWTKISCLSLLTVHLS